MLELSCATWNIHRAKGRDGNVNPGRVVEAIGTALVPHADDILALQEADGECRPHASILDVARVAELTGLDYVHNTLSLRWGPQSDGFLGTILFLHPRFEQVHADLIDLPGHCHRGAVSVETKVDGKMCRIMSTHLSLSQPLRIIQMRIIGQYLRRRPDMQTILLGDLNEWRPWGGIALSRKCVGTKLCGPSLATFPTGRPLLPLDRILTNAPGTVKDVSVIDTPETNLASDHRPLAGRVIVG
ncbi:Metal-dependent hydrolase, endonuclease/exonuclease/phosphatase family [Cognatiyoonia koreensis]|uniref:Metal-dependent hydrolase, endonuclease/exonuclease/phosphatase family n=1 Tax=Cognatiyoonia koreensis TaxID=364200 RepID=A0A1I0QXG9_9RHOB|nr:endonuclease/exonuclease/phosphatase family protein [Cognatiyoonia koreensis]SEW32235.1 Metal-dependent hydrolase, endonuclease/exonuclease/phosphatase family [Cognatiyoonia koreensis]